MRRERYDPEDFEDPEALEVRPRQRQPRQAPAAQAQFDGRSPQEVLYADFGIRPGLPIATKVEQLYLVYKLGAPEIAGWLQIAESAVQEIIDALEGSWIDLGKPLSPEAKLQMRGKLIAELQRTAYDVDTLLSTVDPTEKAKLLNLKLTLAERIAKLQRLDEKDPVIEDEATEEVDPVMEAMLRLSPIQQEELYYRFTGKPHLEAEEPRRNRLSSVETHDLRDYSGEPVSPRA